MTKYLCLLICLAGSLLASLSLQAQEEPYLRLDAGGHNAPVYAVLFTPDAKRLISIGYDKAIRLWDTTGTRKEPIQTFRYEIGGAMQGALTAAALLPDPARPILVLGVRGEGQVPSDLLVINYTTGQVLDRIDSEGDLVTALKFSADGKRLVVGTATGKLLFYQAAGATWKRTRNIKVSQVLDSEKGDYISAVAISPNGQQVAVTCIFVKDQNKKGFVQIYEFGNGKEGRYIQSDSPIYSLDWTTNGQLAWGALNGVTSLFRPGADATPNEIASQGSSVNSLAYSPDGALLLTAGGEAIGTRPDVHVRSTATGQDVATFNKHTTTVFALATSPDGKQAASADASGRIYLWNIATGELIADLSGGGEPLGKLGWSPDGRFLAWGDLKPDNTMAHAFDLQQIQPANPPAPNLDWQQRNARNQKDSLRIEGFIGSKTIKILKGNQQVGTIETRFPLRCYTFTPDGDVVVGTDGGLLLYDTQGKQTGVFKGHEGVVNAVAVSPGNPHYLASASNDRTVRIWSLEPQARQQGVVVPLVSLFVADDGRWIAWTPPGYYYASPDGEKLIGWQINKGAKNPALYYDTTNFKSRFRRRDLIRLVAESGDVQKGIAQYNITAPEKQKVDAKASITVEAQKTPTVDLVRLDAPAAKGASNLVWTTTQPQATIRVHINGVADQQTANLKLSRPFISLTEARTRSLELKRKVDTNPNERILTVDLQPNDNEIHLQSSAPGPDSSYGPPLVLHINYTPPAAVDTRGSLYALAIGVQNFDDPQINAAMVKHTVDDAVAVTQACKQNAQGLYKTIHVADPLLDKEATSEKVLAGVSSLMKQAQPGDTVLLYLSSHGVRPPKGADATRGGSALYFAMSNTVLDEKKFYSSSLACDDLLKVINDNVNEAVHVLLVLDTCYSGKLADAATYNEAISNLREHVYVMTSCDVNEESLEDNTVWKHGLFTGALLEGLSSMAQPYRMQGKDGSLTLFDLEFYVKRRVHDRIETDANLFGGHKQNPMLYGPGDRYFPLFKVR